MTLRLSRKHHQQLLAWADAAANHECCGLLLGEGKVVSELELTDNVALDTTRHFEIDPVALIRRHKAARTGGLPIIGCFHSHPNGVARPSAEDSRMAANDGQYWLIIAGDGMTAWKQRDEAEQSSEFEPVILIVEG